MNIPQTSFMCLQAQKKSILRRSILFPFDLLFLVNADSSSAVCDRFVFDYAVDKSIKSIIGADAHIYAGMEMSASLTIDDVAGDNGLTVAFFGAETLSTGVSAVLGRTNTFFMCKELY